MQNSTETLHTCPTCQTPGFTSRGLVAHRCKGINRSLPAAPGGASQSEPQTLTVVAPGTLSNDAQMGEQLTAQYKRAVSGMREVLIFGAMLKRVENSLSNVDTLSVRGLPKTGHGIKGGGLKGWLEEHAPEISRPTAMRFLGVAEAVAEEYQAIVGAKVAKAYDLPALVLADAGDLDAHAALKQGELFDYVAGTSQRSWLDRFSPSSPRGGARVRGQELTAEQEIEVMTERFRKDTGIIADSLENWTRRRHFQVLNDAELDRALEIIEQAQAAVKAWRDMPKSKRLATAVQDEIRAWKGTRK